MKTNLITLITLFIVTITVPSIASGFYACSTQYGTFPMPNAVPQVGLPCGNGMNQGVTIFIPDTQPGFPSTPQPIGYRGQVAGALGANREMQLAAECSAAGTPQAVGVCIAGRLTAEEIQKCSNGIGSPNGCFGPSNTLRQAVENAVSDLTQGPGDHNDLTGREGYTCKHLGICF